MKDIVKHSRIKDAHFLSVTPDGRKDRNELAITFESGTGENYGPTDRAQVDIWVAGARIFTGTFEDLRGTIKAGKQIEQEGITINAYKIKYSSLWDAYQVNHTTSEEIGQADFRTLQDAINYATNG